MSRVRACLAAIVLFATAGCGANADNVAGPAPAPSATPSLPELSWGYPQLQWFESPELRVALPGAATLEIDHERLDAHTIEDLWTTPAAALAIIRDPSSEVWDLRRRLRQAVTWRDGTLVSARSGTVLGRPALTGRMTRVLDDTINTIDLQLIACDGILVEVMTATIGSAPAGSDRYLDTVLRAIVSTLELKDCAA